MEILKDPNLDGENGEFLTIFQDGGEMDLKLVVEDFTTVDGKVKLSNLMVTKMDISPRNGNSTTSSNKSDLTITIYIFALINSLLLSFAKIKYNVNASNKPFSLGNEVSLLKILQFYR